MKSEFKRAAKTYASHVERMERTYDRDELEQAECVRVVLHNNLLSIWQRIFGKPPHDRHEVSDYAFKVAKEQ